MAIALSSILAPLLRLGPGGDFVSDVAADRPGANHSVEAGEGGTFDPNSEGPGNGAMYAPTRRGTDAFQHADPSGVSPDDAADADNRDALVLSDVARRAGALMVAQRLLSAQAVVSQVLSRAAVFMNIARPPEPPRVLRHPPDEAPAPLAAHKSRPPLVRIPTRSPLNPAPLNPAPRSSPNRRPGGTDGLLW